MWAQMLGANHLKDGAANKCGPEGLLSALRHIGAQSVTLGTECQIRETKRQRIAHYIAHRLRPESDIAAAVAIANAATDAHITTKALTKPRKHADCRDFHVRLRIAKGRN